MIHRLKFNIQCMRLGTEGGCMIQRLKFNIRCMRLGTEGAWKPEADFSKNNIRKPRVGHTHTHTPPCKIRQVYLTGRGGVHTRPPPL